MEFYNTKLNIITTSAGSEKSLAIKSTSADTSYITLTFDVESGYQLNILSYSFAHRDLSTGYAIHWTATGKGNFISYIQVWFITQKDLYLIMQLQKAKLLK